MNIFGTLPQGDSAVWLDDPVTDSQGVLYTSAGYALSYILAGPVAAPVTLIAVANATGWKTTLTPTVSATLPAGTYWWSAVLTAAGVRVTAGSGELTITQNLATITGTYDGRSAAERALADAEAALATFRSSQGRVKAYSIGSRHMQFQDDQQILAVISYWRAKVVSEGAASKIAQGLGNPRNLFTRFVS